MDCFLFPGFHIFFRFGELFLVILIVAVLFRVVSEPRDRYPSSPRGSGESGLFCTRCGSELRQMASFCANCGTKRG